MAFYLMNLSELKQQAIAKHGENKAMSLAILQGNPQHKATWKAVLDTPTASLNEIRLHKLWQKKVKRDLNNVD